MAKLLFNRDDHPDLTYADVFIQPHNDIESAVANVLNGSDRDAFIALRNKSKMGTTPDERLANEKEYFSYVMKLAKKFNLDTPLSRDDVDFTPLDALGNHTPIVSTNMNRVTGKRMAECMARMGGAGAIPQDKDDEELRAIAEYLSSRTEYPTPIIITPDTSVKELNALLEKRDSHVAIVTDDDGKFLGIVDQNDIYEGENRDSSIKNYIKKDDVVTKENGISPLDALHALGGERVPLLPVLNSDGTVAGAFTKKEAAYAHKYTAFEGANGGLAFLPSIGALNNNPIERVRLMIELGARGIVLDTANLDQGMNAYNNISEVRKLIESETDRQIAIIAGNVVTRDAVRRALSAGADIVKVGIGPGFVCSTRLKTGVGRPQMSAVIDCSEEAGEYGKHIWADGGIVYPRDLALALTHASQAMFGTVLTATAESAADLHIDDHGKVYAENIGMAASASSIVRTANRDHQQSKTALIRDTIGHRSEGEKTRVYQRPGEESTAHAIHHYMDGLTSSIAYTGSLTMNEFQRNARIGVQMPSGYKEGLPK